MFFFFFFFFLIAFFVCVYNHSILFIIGIGKSVMGNNSLYTANGNVTICGLALKEWQQQGNEVGTTSALHTPTMDDDLISWAKAVLW